MKRKDYIQKRAHTLCNTLMDDAEKHFPKEETAPLLILVLSTCLTFFLQSLLEVSDKLLEKIDQDEQPS